MRLPDPSSLPRPWLASYPPGVPPTYAYPDVPLTRFLDDAARDFPGTTAIWFDGATIDYADLLDVVDRFATSLGDLGVGRGDRVAVGLPDLPATVIALFAILRIGAVVVPCDPHRDDAALFERLHGSGAEVAILDAALVPRVVQLRARLRHLRHLITTSAAAWPLFHRGGAHRLRDLIRRAPARDDARSMAALIAGSDPIAKQEPLDPHDPAVIAYAGSGEDARAVVLTHGNLTANAFQARLWVPDAQAGRERVVVALSSSLSRGLTVALFAGVLSAATLVLVGRRERSRALDAISTTRSTIVAGTPEFFEGLVRQRPARRRNPRSVRLATYAGALDPAVAARFEALTEARLRATYGVTEASSLTHANPMYGRNVSGSIGLPVTDTVAAVVDEDGRLQPAGQPGRLVVSGPQVAASYWGPPPSAGPELRGGWVVTRELAVADADGYFRVVR